MSITLELELPPDIASEASQAGLLQSGPISDLLAREIQRRKSAVELKSILSDIRSQPGERPTGEEIQDEIDRARKLRRMGESRS
jgi:hypothetical protein